MNAIDRMYALIALCVAGAFLIEAHDFFAMRVHRSVAVDLARQAEREQAAEKSKSDNREQIEIQHRAISF